NLFSALKLEKTVYFLVLLLMVLIGAFNIISTLVMVVMEKKKDIAILRSMGATQGSIRRIFLLKGCIIGVIGTALGVVLGLLVCWLMSEYGFQLPDGVFLISTVPVRVYAGNVVLVAATSFAVCLLASLYPARQAAKLDPVAVVGESGVGKSTLLHILGTLDRPNAGKILFAGRELPLDDETALCEFRNRQIGFVFQFHYLLPDFSALENVMFPALIQGMDPAEAKSEAARLLDLVGLADRLGHRPGKLSGGEQ